MIELESLIGIFTIDKGRIQILLRHKKKDPYKGYWILPGSTVQNETLEDNITSIIVDKLGLPSLYVEQCHTFSALDRIPDKRVVATTYMGLIDNVTLYLKKEPRDGVELAWFDIHEIPKMAYDHEKIIAKLVEYFKGRIINSNILRILFPSDFTLPELQKVYEQILSVSLDRRNFRKKLINLGYIEDTGDINEGVTGRPAKLYRFKENIKEKNLF